MKKSTEVALTTGAIAFALGFLVTEMILNGQYRLVVPALALIVAAAFHFRTHFFNYDRDIRDDHK